MDTLQENPTSLNIPLIEEVKKFLREEPRRFDMNEWIGDASFYREDKKPPCGTVCCFAGAVVICGTDVKTFRQYLDAAFAAGNKATELLGISLKQANNLYYTNNWPEPFKNRFDSIVPSGTRDYLDRKKQEVEVLCDRLDYLVATGN